jgi:uncharacterized membrane protein YccC
LLLVGAAVLITHAALNTARRTLIDRLEQSSAALRQMLTEQVQLDVETLFGRFHEMLQPAREKANQRENQMHTQTERLRVLIGEFESLEAEIVTSGR